MLQVLYTYDAWGKILSIKDGNGNEITSDTNIGKLNSLRYRSYYYDTETGLFYVGSRYYNPEWGRFLNADDTSTIGASEGLLTSNLFVYGVNNPVNMFDADGYWPKWATKVLIGAAVIAAIAVVTVATAGSGTAVACIAAGALQGAITGAATGAATGAVIGAVSHRLRTGSWKGAGQAALNGGADGFMWGAIGGAIGGGLISKACFVAGTAVLNVTGKKAIEAIKPGDLVYSENPETGELGLKKVVRTFVHEVDHLVHVKTADGQEIKTTDEHPFWVIGKGFVGASHLQYGDNSQLENGKTIAVNAVWIEQLTTSVKVYNFEVADWHTYFVGNDSVLVHNQCVGNWSEGNFGSSRKLSNYHFGKHGAEVGAQTLEQYTTKATNFANQVLQKGIKGRYIGGATPNTYRYTFNGKYVDMAWNGTEHILVSFGKIVR